GVTNPSHIMLRAEQLQKAIGDAKNARFIDFIKDFLQTIGYTEYMLSSTISRDKLLLIDKLFDEIKKQQTKGDFGLNDFITLVDSYLAYHIAIESSNPEIESGVQLMTAHGSKGKEFEYVYVLNTVSKQ